jgi:hypothetical protein
MEHPMICVVKFPPHIYTIYYLKLLAIVTEPILLPGGRIARIKIIVFNTKKSVGGEKWSGRSISRT